MFRSRSKSPVFVAIIDALLWFLFLPLALGLRLIDHQFAWSGYDALLLVSLSAALVQIFLGYLTGLYRGRYRFATFDEIKGLAFVIGVTSLLPISLIVFTSALGPRTIGVIASALVMAGAFFVRFIFRSYYERRQRSLPGLATLIYGAGEVGASLAQQMNRDSNRVYRPIGFIDDDPNKKRLEIFGYKVLGKAEQLEEILALHAIKVLVVAFTKADSQILSYVEKICREREIRINIVPSSSKLMTGNIKLSDLSSLSEEDLLGRKPIEVDENAIIALLKGKRVLITGAGGSIGSEIARQVHRYSPAQVFMLDRDETLLQQLQLSLDGRGLLTNKNMILADIRDCGRINEVFNEVRPQLVFHAAALKHLPLLELYPDEAYKTNVLGTKNVLEAAMACHAKSFVNISTDKAVNPISILGKTKNEAEKLVSEASKNLQSSSRYLSVRFGNVLGSRGSVLDTFRAQISRGGPVTITHKDARRYFMTIPEAVHLVLEASAKGKAGETLILDMGEPVKIYDLAQKLIARSGKNVEIEFTGLRPGEKMDEELIKEDEVLHRSGSGLIRISN